MAVHFLHVTLPDGTDAKRQSARPYTHVLAFRSTPETLRFEANSLRKQINERLIRANRYEGLQAGTVKPWIRSFAVAFDRANHQRFVQEGDYAKWAKYERELAGEDELRARLCENHAADGWTGPWEALSWHGSFKLAQAALAARSGFPGEYKILEVILTD